MYGQNKKQRRGRLRGWLPWRAFDGMGLNWREHRDSVRDMRPQDVRRHALMLVVVGLVLATCAAAYALPRISLLIDLGGALLVATVVLFLTGQWQELHRGLREAGHWPEAGVQLQMIRQYILDLLMQAQDRRRERRALEPV